MYSRSYPNPQKGLIPPNYSGNAFDLARERRGADDQKEHRESCDRCAGESLTSRDTARRLPFGSLLSRRDGKRIEGDDILLAGLIILLLTSGADEELILILGFLFLVGL